MRSYLDFEKPVGELEQKIEELRAMQASGDVSVADEIERLEAKATQTLRELYENLTPWQKTQVARWPTRPHCLDYVAGLITDFTPLAGDRKFGDDEAIVGGFGRFHGESVCIIGQEKGATTESLLKHNFGMARAEGYRESVRPRDVARRFGSTVSALVGSVGARAGGGGGVIDEIVPEPVGGAHRDPAAAIQATGTAIGSALSALSGLDRETVRRARREKFLNIGRVL